MNTSPGPWKLETRAHVHAIVDANGDDVVYQNVAPVGHRNYSPETLRDNARLIAAAPTMLLALQKIRMVGPCACGEKHGSNPDCPITIAVNALTTLQG
jgi:hypothetical protein